MSLYDVKDESKLLYNFPRKDLIFLETQSKHAVVMLDYR